MIPKAFERVLIFTAMVAVAVEARGVEEMINAEPPRRLTIAAKNSAAYEKKTADYVCDGRNDEEELNLAVARLRFGGTIRLADGDYCIDAFLGEGNSAVYFDYNDGDARTITIEGTTESKGYNTQHGAVLHVTRAAMDAMAPDQTYRVFYGTERKPDGPGDFYTYTHVNNVNFRNFILFFANASRRLIGIDGRAFGSMELDMIGIYQESYFTDRFMHIGAPSISCEGTVGVWSVPKDNDESARGRYNEVNVGGLHRGFVMDGVDSLVMTCCLASRCIYGYWFESGTPKTMTIINCADEGNRYLPRFRGRRGHVTMIDFNIERFNENFIPADPVGKDGEACAVEEFPGAWKGTLSYTMQGNAFGVQEKRQGKNCSFFAPGSGSKFTVRDFNEDN